jgi:hypothetical protein
MSRHRQVPIDFTNMPDTMTVMQADNRYSNMMTRCLRTDIHPTYEGCAVCEEWQISKQAFLEWIFKNYYEVDNERMELDKDILVKGNRVYSPSTCCFVPHSINNEFNAQFMFPEYTKDDETGMWHIRTMKNEVFTGETIEDVIASYIPHREAELKAIADKYKGKIPQKVYDAIVNWKLTIDDWDFRMFGDNHYINYSA